MAILKSRWEVRLVIIAAALMFSAKSALAVNEFCDFVAPTECQVTGPHNVSGPFTIDRTLHIFGTGSLVTGATGIDITIAPSGNFLMDSGALIDANASPVGGPITVTLADGDVDLATGSIIRSNGPSGGAIKITTTQSHTINIDGTVESVGTLSGVGGNQPPGGGTITIIAGCSLTVSDTGKVSSRGQDPGADLVHLEACVVTIYGLVESTGAGHALPTDPANHCNLEPGAHDPGLDPSEFFTGCVEIWSGTTVLIDSTGTHKGEVNADVGFAGGNEGRGWIDIYANGNITIRDGAGNDRIALVPPTGPGTYATTFAVHSNGGLIQNTDDGGLITIKSLFADVIAESGDAIQADATTAGSNGGNVYVEAFNNVTFTANLFARGDADATGGFGDGGTLGTALASIRAFNGALNWTSGTGDVRPTGSAIPLANRGEIHLEACTGTTLGATFPVNGAAVPPFPVVTAGCGSGPTKATLGALPVATCLADFCVSVASKCGKKFNDADNSGSFTVGDTPIGGWPINLLDTSNNVLASTTTDAVDGTYCFLGLQPGTYRACEGTGPAGFVQTFPNASLPNPAPNSPAETVISTCPAPNVWGYEFTLASGDTFTDDDFGNFKPTVTCPEDPNRAASLTRTVGQSQFNGGAGVPGNPKNYATVQSAYNDAKLSVNAEVIGLFTNTNENLLLDGSKSLTITQCTSARVTGVGGVAAPVWDITSTGKLLIIGPDSVGGTVGWRVNGGGGHTIKALRASGASQYGVLVLSDNNSVSWNEIKTSPVGLRVEGDFNTLTGGTIQNNTGDGAQLAASANNNTFQVSNVQLNGGNGILVAGSTNTIKDGGRIDSNGLSGVYVTGSGNTLKNLQAGSDASKGNGTSNTFQANVVNLAGIQVTGANNILDNNRQNANKGWGVFVSGASTTVKNNQSNTGSSGSTKENTAAEYRFTVPIVGAVSNKKDNAAFASTAAGTYE